MGPAAFAFPVAFPVRGPAELPVVGPAVLAFPSAVTVPVASAVPLEQAVPVAPVDPVAPADPVAQDVPVALAFPLVLVLGPLPAVGAAPVPVPVAGTVPAPCALLKVQDELPLRTAPSGRLPVTITFCAAEGPLLVTVVRYGSACPGRVAAGPVLVTDTSAVSATVVTGNALEAVAVPHVTVAVLATRSRGLAVVDTFALRTPATVCPGFSEPSAQTAVPGLPDADAPEEPEEDAPEPTAEDAEGDVADPVAPDVPVDDPDDGPPADDPLGDAPPDDAA